MLLTDWPHSLVHAWGLSDKLTCEQDCPQYGPHAESQMLRHLQLLCPFSLRPCHTPKLRPLRNKRESNAAEVSCMPTFEGDLGRRTSRIYQARSCLRLAQ